MYQLCIIAVCCHEVKDKSFWESQGFSVREDSFLYQIHFHVVNYLAPDQYYYFLSN